jgi:hypothetical protein
MLTVERIKNRMRQLKHAFFENGALNLNIVGFRTLPGTPDRFDDTLYVIYRKSASSSLMINAFKVTLDPGLYWLRNPSHVEGTAILAPGQYRSAWKLGLHKGQYKALVQDGEAVFFRDRDKDDQIDLTGRLFPGVIGANIHRAAAKGETQKVGKYSAGCTVFADRFEYDFFMDLCERSSKLYGPRFTYTVLHDWSSDES